MRRPTTEERETDLQRAAPALSAAAEELAEAGHRKPADLLRELASVEDLYETAARSLVRLEEMEEAERDVTMAAVYNVCRRLLEAGDDRSPGPLTEWLEQVMTVYGAPGDRAA